MVRGTLTRRLGALAAVVLATAGSGPAPLAAAAFPGTDGLIVFERETPAGDHTQTDLYTVGPKGSGVDQLTSSDGLNEFGPAWGPGGNRIAFWRTPAPFGPGAVWVMDADGTDQRRLTTGIDARDPAWSPSGKRLIYHTNFDLFTLRTSDGGDQQRITRGAPLDFEPAWSPDGTKIAFTRGYEQGDVGNIHILDLSTHTVRGITHGEGYDHQVAWSPGGHRLVFERDFAHTSQIVSIRPDGSDERSLTSGPFFDIGPAFSPSGTSIVFGSDRPSSGFHDLWVMSRGGANMHRLLEMEFAEGMPDWQPAP